MDGVMSDSASEGCGALRIRLLACEVFCREVCSLASASPTTCDVEFLPKGLHDLGSDRMLAHLQARVDAAGGGYDAVALVYGLCNNGVVGLKARDVKLVIPKAHDCMTLFMGDRRRYRAYFEAHPGTYYRTSGWFEHNRSDGTGEQTVSQRLGLFQAFGELVEKYGEENARYIQEILGNGVVNYDRLTYIDMGLPRDAHFRQQAVAEAAERGWAFDSVMGSLELMRKLLDGQWDDDFIMVPPGHVLQASYAHPDEMMRVSPG